MMGSPFIHTVAREVETWDKKLSTVSEVLDEWMNCQRNWRYLEPIFSAPDIQKQLPSGLFSLFPLASVLCLIGFCAIGSESKRFAEVDRRWKDAMKKAHRNPNVVQATHVPSILDMFSTCNREMDAIQQSLDEYLETKRASFPRFYFLSDNELLQILSQTRDPQTVQPHLRTIFESIVRLRFADATQATAMISAEGEEVDFHAPVMVQGSVESWLSGVEEMMQLSVKGAIKRALHDYPANGLKRSDWFTKFPAQAVLTVDQIVWTHLVTQVGALFFPPPRTTL